MTAPALPPEVDAALGRVLHAQAVLGYAQADATSPHDLASRDAQVAVLVLRTAIARALGGDGEPVAWQIVARDGTPAIAYASLDSAMEHIGPGETMRPLFTRPAATGDTGEGDCPHHSETGLGGCGRFAWHCDGCGRIRWIYDASKGIGSRADVPRGVVLEGPPTTAVEIARRMLTLGDVALLLERAGSSDDEQGSARRTLLRLEALRNALAAEATRAATGGPDAR